MRLEDDGGNFITNRMRHSIKTTEFIDRTLTKKDFIIEGRTSKRDDLRSRVFSKELGFIYAVRKKGT